MIIFPAIDIRGGKCVRLQQGRFDRECVYGTDPVIMAQQWEKKGAKYLHVVDLDGALNGIMENGYVIKKIIQSLHIPVQLGGGIRRIEDIQRVLEMGVSRIILGTSALQDKSLIEDALRRFEDKIIVSVDARNGYVAVDGWTKISKRKAIDFVRELESIGLKTIIFTDIEKDGMLTGPNFNQLKILKSVVNMDIIASGGISSIEHIDRLKTLNIYGAIIGKALYTGQIKLEEL